MSRLRGGWVKCFVLKAVSIFCWSTVKSVYRKVIAGEILRAGNSV